MPPSSPKSASQPVPGADANAGREQLELALEAGRMVAYDWDLDTGAGNWLGDARGIFGFTGGCLEDWLALVHPADQARVREAAAGAKAGEPIQASEYRLLLPDGRVLRVEDKARLLRDAGGRPRRLRGVLADITARRETEEALRVSEERERAALALHREREASHQALTRRLRFLNELDETTRELTDPEIVMAVIARQLGEHLGVSRCAYADVDPGTEEFDIRHDYTNGCASTVGHYRLSLFGAGVAAGQRAGRTLVVHDVDRALAPGEGAEMFNAIGIKAIICCPLVKEERLVAMMAVHQTVPRQWTAAEVELVEAVVERSWASIERARAARALTQSAAQFRLLADAMPQMVWTTRADGYHEYFNRPWYDYTGATLEETRGEGWSRILHPDDFDRTVARWRHSLETGEPYEIEYRFRRAADGAYRWFLARALPVRDNAGQITLWVGTCTDIEEAKRGETEFLQLAHQREHLLESERAARSEAERVGRIKDEFLATLSHELRTPLNAILGWTQLLLGGARAPEDLEDGLRTIERNARAQTQIIEDLLDMSRIVSGKVRLDVQRLDLVPVVEAAIETVRPAAEAKGIRIQPALDPAARPVSGDPHRLQQVFWNLLSNAIKFTPKGGRVQVLLERVDSHLEVSVADSGQGIAADFLPHVFDRFRQADASSTRAHGGLGLGLAIVKQLVELHGGTVRVRSGGHGQGTTFTVGLPLTVLHAGTEPPEGERRHPQAGFSPAALPAVNQTLDGLKIVVVDDEADARALVKRLLEDRGATVRAAGSAAEALELVRSEKPDVLISDIGMPGEDGYSLIRQVRALGPERGGNVPAVALTAYARTEDRMKAVLAGFQMHVAKPVEAAELLAMVASLSGRAGGNGGGF